MNNNQLCSPATIKFTQNSRGNAKGFLWDFGNNSKSNLPNPEIIFNNPGTYKVRLIVVYENSTAEISKNIIIKPNAPASLNTDKDQFCAAATVQLTAQSSATITNFQWDFGDNTAVQNSNSASITHSYTNFGDFTAKVTCTSSNGCKSIANKVIKIKEPVIIGSFTINSGCVPVANTFHSSIIVPQTSIVNNYHWDLGDGNVLNNNSASLIYNYNFPGNFSPKLTITTNDGCLKTFSFDSVHYGSAPVNLIAQALDTILCGSESAEFTAKADNADYYDWNFGNGTIVSTTDTFIKHKFTSLGTKTVSVTPRFNNCTGASKIMHVEVIGVIANFAFQNSCNSKRTFNFNNLSSGNNLNFLWNFGDQTASASAHTISHTYPRTGLFNTMLIASDPISGCVDSAKASIETIIPNLINPHTTICINTGTTFRVTNTYHNNTTRYTWNIMGTQIGPDGNEITGTIATALGDFTNHVIINNGRSYCPDTIYLNHHIIVTGPDIKFNADSSFCLSTPLTISNLSSPYLSSDSIIKYYWNFGDSPNNIESITSPSHQYNAQGTYTVKLTGVDIKGCRDSLVKTINVRPMPFLWIIPRKNNICFGGRDSIIAYTSDSLLWSTSIPTPNFCVNCDTNMISPAHTTYFYASSTNIYNCKSIDSSYVKIYEPFTANAFLNDTSICEHNSVELKVSPNEKKITWTPSTGLNISNNYNPTSTPTHSTVYLAELTDSAGCFSSNVAINVRVNPNPTVDLGNNKLLPYNSIFTFNPGYSSNVASYDWTPANALSCSGCAYPQTTVNDLKSFAIKVTSDSGCIATDNVILAVECNNAYIMMPGAFTPNNDGLNDIYYPLGNGIKHIKRFAIYNRNSQLVFEQKEFRPNNRSYGWNGKYLNSIQPVGAYVYVIEAACEFGQTTIKKGSFMLLN